MYSYIVHGLIGLFPCLMDACSGLVSVYIEESDYLQGIMCNKTKS